MERARAVGVQWLGRLVERRRVGRDEWQLLRIRSGLRIVVLRERRCLHQRCVLPIRSGLRIELLQRGRRLHRRRLLPVASGVRHDVLLEQRDLREGQGGEPLLRDALHRQQRVLRKRDLRTLVGNADGSWSGVSVCEPSGIGDCRCTNSSECSGACAPLTDGSGNPVGPYVCKPNDAAPYDSCFGAFNSCPGQYCCVADSNGNEFCAAPCANDSNCGAAHCDGFDFSHTTCSGPTACGR